MKLNPGDRIDELGRKNYKIIQNPKFFNFGTDAVLLSHFAKVKNNSFGVDLCSGGGIIPLLMHARNDSLKFSAIEIQTELCQLAKRSVELNNLSEKIEIIEADLREVSSFFPKDSADFVTVNPPYMPKNLPTNKSYEKMVARHEIFCTIDDIASAASHILKPMGSVFMVHRPQRLADICCSFRNNGLEIKIIQLVLPKANKTPSNVLIKATKGGKPGVLMPLPIVVYDENNNQTSLLKEIYNG